MFYFTRNFENQKIRFRKTKKNYNADVDADDNVNGKDAKISKLP